MPGRILVVDDDPNIQRLLTYTLRQEGYEVSLATDGEEGLSRFESDAPDLLLVDILLPKIDGLGLTSRIRAGEVGGGHVPIILLTADTDATQKVKGLRAGADDLQVKPFHPAELLARIKALLARFAPREQLVGRPPLGRVQAYYGAKGGVGTTTLAINAAIALHRELGRRVVLVDGNLQFGDHRVFLDLGLDRKSIVDVVSASSIDQELIRSVVVKHDSGVDLLLAPPSPETADLVSAESHHMARILATLRDMYDYVIVDIDKRLDDNSLDVITAADTIFVVMTADLSCLKNVRLILETMANLGLPPDKMELVLNRSNAFTGITARTAEGALRRKIDHQIVNEYRGAISALNSGHPFMVDKQDTVLGRAVLEFVRVIDKSAPAPAPASRLVAAASGVPART
ncbi:MAG TPA: response regulator [Candidatus Limnocylindrales bacterium]|nr:response regulator [Candidatus Limnocylindrales bacterium]